MLADLHKCPTLFATTPENVCVMTKMSSDAKRLIVTATSASGANGKKEFDEDALTAIRDASSKRLSWDRFFDELQTAFNSQRVECKDAIKVKCPFSVEGESCTFTLDTSTDDGQKSVLDALIQYHYTHTHPKEVEKQLEEATKREAEVKGTATDLEKEETSLKAIIERSKDQDVANQKRLLELKVQLAQVEDEKRRAGETLDDAEDDDETCRVRNPLYEKDSKPYDKDLFTLIKSKYINEADSSPYNSVMRPYTSSELQQHTTTFSTEQRSALWNCLKKIDEWDYDVFKLQSTMSGDDHYSLASQPNGGSLMVTMYALLFRHGMMQKFKMDEKTVMNWLSVVEAGYHGNPYHNSMHAADVLHVTHFILSKGGLIKKCALRDEDVLGALISATIHDYDHPGINNSFHIRAQTYLATLYNDRSILENRHVSSVFELMKLPKFNILAGFSEDQRRDVRDTVVEMVLATDMGLHSKYFQQWKRRIAENHNFEKKDDIRLALAMSLKMADISNCGRPHDLYMRWGQKISDEFYMQGDREKNFGLSISPFMDRSQPGMAKSQISFMNFVVVPLFESIAEFVPDMRFSLECTENNKSFWQEHQEDM